MVAGLEPRKERVKILIKYSCTTNDINNPNYFDDYYEEKWVERIVSRKDKLNGTKINRIKTNI